jgi:hypothetical protein
MNYEPSPAELLFYTKFYVHVQNRAFYTVDELENIGFVSAGTDKDNEAYLNDFRLVQCTVPQIAEWNARGEAVKLIKFEDATDMYKLIVNHLDTWITVSAAHPYATYPPIEDIEALDNLAELLHPLVDLKVEAFSDPLLMLMLGNALDFSYLVPKGENKEPYVKYAPKLYPFTLSRWNR